MLLEPIPESGHSSDPRFSTAACREILEVYKSYYPKIGFELPWIGYFMVENGVAVGSCGFTGKPEANTVEVAYFTFPAYERKGYAARACKELIRIATTHSPGIIITAKTAPEENASTAILRRNGFEQDKIVQDHEIGPAWHWTRTP